MIRAVDPLISLPAADPGRARDFYVDTLGLEAIHESPEQGFYIFRPADAEPGGALIGVHRSAGPLPEPGSYDLWVWLGVDEIAPLRERLEAQGVRFLGEPNDLGPGLEQRFLDSEGNVLRFYEPLREVRRSVEIEAAPDAVFAALTDAAAIERWFERIDDVALDPHVGGELRFIDPVFGPVHGRVAVLDPPRRLVLEFSRNWPRHLEITCTPVEGRTRVDVWQHGFDPIRDRDFGIPGMIEQLDQALQALVRLIEMGGVAAITAAAARDLARDARDKIRGK